MLPAFRGCPACYAVLPPSFRGRPRQHTPPHLHATARIPRLIGALSPECCLRLLLSLRGPRGNAHHHHKGGLSPPPPPLTVAHARATPRCHDHRCHSLIERRRGRPRPAVPAHSLHCSRTSAPSVCRKRLSNNHAPPTTTIIDMQRQRMIRLEEMRIFCLGYVDFSPVFFRSSCSRGDFPGLSNFDRSSPPGSLSRRP